MRASARIERLEEEKARGPGIRVKSTILCSRSAKPNRNLPEP